jgi:hypothetical protein
MAEQQIYSGLFTRSEDIPDERFRFFCSECGEPIKGIPYLTTWHGWCACFDPWDFCSEECWNKNDLLNTANWPPPKGTW